MDLIINIFKNKLTRNWDFKNAQMFTKNFYIITKRTLSKILARNLVSQTTKDM